MQRCCRAVIERTLRETDTPEEASRKRLWMPIMVVVYPVVPTYLLIDYAAMPRAKVIGLCIAFLALSFGTWWPVLRRELPLRLVTVCACVLAVSLILIDLADAAAMESFRSWAWVVLIMDVCLAVNMGTTPQLFVISLMCAWILVYSAESAYRLGLYDIEHFSKPSRGQPVCDCDSPPCGGGAPALLDAVSIITILCGDYFATRGFASGLRTEQARMCASAEVAEQVASSLAGFDLEAAENVMTQAGVDLPLPLAGSFRRLLRNLSRYRPYLPQSCFEEDEGSEGGSGERSNAESDTSPRQGPARGGGPVQRRDTGRSGRSAGPRARGSVWSVKDRLESFVSIRSGSERSDAWSCPGDAVGPHHHTAHAPQHRQVTLLTCNRINFLAAPLGTESVSAWLAEVVGEFVSAVKAQGGVSDAVCGDHHSANFGAVKAQGSQRIAATRAAVAMTAPGSGANELQALPRTAAVCSGRALCGDFGSSTCQRFQVIGGVSAFLPAAERAAAAWGIRTLIDSEVQGDVEQFWSSRLRKIVKFTKRGPKPVGLWELLGERMREGTGDEWMYELANADANPWEPYNAAVRMWCEGHAEAALVGIAKAMDHTHPSAGEVVAALVAVRELVQRGAPPPVGDFTAVTFAGAAAPLAARGDAFA